MTSILISDWLHQVYVFGARMGRADLGYVMKTNDKVQLELAELDTVILRFGVEIRWELDHQCSQSQYCPLIGHCF